MSRKSFQTPQNRRSMLGIGSATAKMKQKNPPEKKHLTFSANRSNTSKIGKKWSSQGTHQLKDTRPLTNRTYQKQMIEDILEFLNETGYPHAISAKVLSAPTTKEFLRVFEHLYSLVNADFQMDKKYEEEVPRILKSLGYPFTLSKSAMFAIGSLHTWPSILGALHWMVECIRMINLIDVEEILFPNDDDGWERIFFEFNTQTYADYLSGIDDHTEAKQQLEQTLLLKAGYTEEELNALKDEVECFEQQICSLENDADVYEAAVKQKELLEEKLAQHEVKLHEYDKKDASITQQREQLENQAREAGMDLPTLGDPSHQEETKYKSSEVKQQLERYNVEKERLEQQNNEKEMKYSKLYDQSLAVYNQYNDLAKILSVNPIISKFVGDNGLELYYDHNQKDSTKLKHEVKDNLKHLLFQVRNYAKEQRYGVDAENITLEEKYEKQSQLYLEKEHEALQLKTKLLSLEKTRGTHSEGLDTDYEHQKNELQHRQDVLESGLQHIKQTLDTEMAELQKLKSEVNEADDRHTLEKNDLNASLVQFICEAQERKKRIKDGFNSLLIHFEREIKGVDSVVQD